MKSKECNSIPTNSSGTTVALGNIYNLKNVGGGEEECTPSTTKFSETMFGRSPFRDIYNVYFSYPRSSE